MRIRIPSKLKKGDTIGIIAPSRYVHEFKTQIDQGVLLLRKMGFNIVFGKNFEKREYFSAGTVDERLHDLQEMFQRKDVKAIFCALGGDSANQLLSRIDYNLVKKNPKIILGASDITNLLLAINKKNSLMTFHGPNVKDMARISKKSLSLLFELFECQSGDKFIFPGKFKVVRHGKATGKLVGGNLLVVNSLLATKFMPNLNGSILFWEELEDDISNVEFELNQLKLSGVLQKISGMVIGNVSGKSSGKKRSIEDVIKELAADTDFPIVRVNYFGHGVKDFFTLPIGAQAELDTKGNVFSVTF